MSVLILTFVSDCTQQHHKSSYVSRIFSFVLFSPTITELFLLEPLSRHPMPRVASPGQCIAAFAASGGTEGREPLVLVISLQSLHSAKHIYSSDSRHGGAMSADAGLSLMLVGTLASSTSCTETDKVSGSVRFPSNINMQIKTNKHHCVCELKLHIMLYQFTKFAAISPFCTGSAAGLCVITGHFVATN